MTKLTPTAPDLPPDDDPEEALREATGTDDPLAQRWLIDQIYGLERHQDPFDPESRESRNRRIAELMRGVRTGDFGGGILASQMIATHKAACDCLRRAEAPAQTPDGADRNTRYASRLLWIATRQIAVMERWRPKQPQSAEPRRVEVCWVDALPEDAPERIEARKRDPMYWHSRAAVGLEGADNGDSDDDA